MTPRNTRTTKSLILCAMFLTGHSRDVFAELQTAQFGIAPTTHRELLVYYTNTAPTIDGYLSDAIWRQLPKITGFKDISFKHEYVIDQTLFSMCYDAENLYLSVDCRERFPDKIKATLTERDSAISIDDSIEFYLDFDNTGKRYVLLMLNAIGTKFDFQAGKRDWSGKWKGAVGRTSNSWTAELALPFKTMGISIPKPGENWRGNVNRNRRAEGKDPYSSWSLLMTGSFHSPKEWGSFIFADPKVKPVKGNEAQINMALLSFFRNHLENTVRKSGHRVLQIERIGGDDRPEWFDEQIGLIESLASTLKDQIEHATDVYSWLDGHQTGAELNKQLIKLDEIFDNIGPSGKIRLPPDLNPSPQKAGSYWLLASADSLFALDTHTGCVAGVWDRTTNLRQINISYELYAIETMKKTISSDELTDRVDRVEKKKAGLVFACSNPDFPGLTITKEYQLQSRMLIKRVSVSSTVKEKSLFTSSSYTLFDKEFRNESYYNRILSSGASGGADNRATIAAESITQDMIQRAGFNTPSGWSQFLLLHGRTSSGIAQYLYKIDDEYVWIPYSLNSSYWNSTGWQMSFMATFLDEKPFTSEMRYHLFQGDQFSFYRDYLALPEVHAARNEINVSPFIAKMKYEGVGDGVIHALNSNFAKMARFAVPYSRLRSDEVAINYFMPSHSIFSQWPSKDSDSLIVNIPPPYGDGKDRKTPAIGDVKEATGIVKTIFPRFLINGFYWWYSDLHPRSELYKNHPEFGITAKDGTQVKGMTFTSFGADQADMSRAFIAAVVPKYMQMFEYLNQDLIYFDNGGGLAVPDWGDGQVVQGTDTMRFLRVLREKMDKRGKFIFMNADTGHLNVDLGYTEILPQSAKEAEETLGKEWWRFLNERIMQYKFFEREGAATILLFWQGYRTPEGAIDHAKNNSREYTNCLLGLGLRAHPCYYDYHTELKTKPKEGMAEGHVEWSAMYNFEEAYRQATLEMHGTRIADVGLKPAYWRDFDTDIEAYVMRLGSGFFFTANNRYDKSRDITLSAEIAKMALVAGNRIFIWNYTRRDDTKVKRLDGPGKSDWDRLFVKVTCQNETISEPNGRFRVEMPSMEPNMTQVVSVSQVPGFIYSVEGQRTQFLIPETLGCRIEGQLKEREKSNSLHVYADKPLEIIAWWPQEWGKAKVEIVGKGALQEEKIAKISYGNEQFLKLSLLKGQTELKIFGTK